MKWRNGLAAIIGIWFIISPWIFDYSDQKEALWTSVIVGAVLLIVSGWALCQEDSSGWAVWQTWVSLLAGIWFVIHPYVFSLDSETMWTTVILGAVTIILNLWTMASSKS
ncbi:hypothetical protein PMSD_01260 [Paenibacillus macquariensis subsp. defensor]|nr:hypothetical protein PMSD_01260 [Paenibacillus macquariensis subsp. defensor]